MQIRSFSKCNSNLDTSKSKWFLLSAFVLLKPMPLIQISSLKAEREDATLWSSSTMHVVHIPFLWLELSPLDLHLTPLLLAKSSPKTPSGQGLDLSGLWNWSDWALSEFLFNWPCCATNLLPLRWSGVQRSGFTSGRRVSWVISSSPRPRVA